jgi:hypothetical protein
MKPVNMSNGQSPCRSHLFTLRLWAEDLGDEGTEWRGQVQYVASGETRYFRDWSSLFALLLAMMSQPSDN